MRVNSYMKVPSQKGGGAGVGNGTGVIHTEDVDRMDPVLGLSSWEVNDN